MALEDAVCTLVPYFTVHEGKLEAFKALGEKMVEQTKNETDVAFSAAGILAHLENVNDLLQEALKIASLDSLEVHAPASEVAALKEPLAGLNPTYFTMETGFRR